MKGLFIWGLFVLLITGLSACTTTTPAPWTLQSNPSITTSELKRFKGVNEFEQYRKDVHKVASENNYWWALERLPSENLLLASTDGGEIPCEKDESCVEEVVVTGSRVSSPQQSITNNQEAGVDEGDIVKHYKNFLIVLQDGRLFVINTGLNSSQLKLVDRKNVYLSSEQGVWYDELLISSNVLVVTGFDYSEGHTEVALFEISETGKLSRGETYYIDSEDYYSGDNYATRLVDGNLIFYTPIDLADTAIDDVIRFPRIRKRKVTGEYTDWYDLFDVADIHWPLQNEWTPTIHVLSVCPIRTKNQINCMNMGITGHPYREFYVTPEYIYLWNYQDASNWLDANDRYIECGQPSYDHATYPSVLYRAKINSPSDVEAVFTYGMPYDQFSLEEREEYFYASVWWPPMGCWREDLMPRQKIVKISEEKFSKSPGRSLRSEYIEIFALRGAGGLENRYSENYYLAGTRNRFWKYPPDSDAEKQRSKLIAIDLDDLERQLEIRLKHDVQRLEVVGSTAIVNGYYDASGLVTTAVDIDRRRPRVTSSIKSVGVYESEGRSHAFNYTLNADDSATLGVPVTIKEERIWNKRSYQVLRDRSDIGFFELDERKQLTNIGLLNSSDDRDQGDYECELSCIDWYGNARPIFLNNRIYALVGSELVEGAILQNAISELNRVSILSPIE